MKKIVVIDDHDIVRFGLKTLIDTSDFSRVIDTANSLESGLAVIARLTPDLVVCDMSMDDSKGLDTVRAVVKAQAPRPVLIVSMHDEMIYAEQTLSIGVKGYLLKEHAQEYVVQAIEAILDGNTWVSPKVNSNLLNRLLKRKRNTETSPASGQAKSLSQRELEVLEKIAQGKTTKEIAFDLDLSPRTVDIHRANIKKKLELKNSADVMTFAMSRL